jgi:hypothetical protein
LFAEDIGYHRFSSVLLNFFNTKEQEKISSLAQDTNTNNQYEENPYENDPLFNNFSKDLDAYNADLDNQIQQATNIG